MAERADHWNAHARAWQHLGPPLRPSAKDVEFFAGAIAAATQRAGNRPISVLLLGVTPELAKLSLPADSTLLAVDRSEGMLVGVWPGDTLGRRAVRGAWTALPLASQSADLVIGDGCYTVLHRLEDRNAVNTEIARVLRPNGRFVVRNFLRPSNPQSPDAVFDDLLHGRIASFHAFKWRLAASLHGTLHVGLAVDDVWQAWAARNIDAARLAFDRSWPVQVVETIANYRGSLARYVLPTLEEARQELAERFVEVDCRTGDYELAPLFPTTSLALENESFMKEEAILPSWSAPRSAGWVARRPGPDAR